MTERAIVTESPLSHVQLHLVESLEDAWAARRWLSQQRPGPLCVDTETTGFNAWKGNIRLIQLGDLDHGWVFPWGERGWAGAAMEMVEAWPGEFAYHNAPFDLKHLIVHAKYQPPWERIHDTMTIAHLHDPTRPRGLKPLADMIVDPRFSAGQHLLDDGMRRQGWNWATVPASWAPYWMYAGLDPVGTAHVFSRLAPEVLSQFSRPYDIERSAIRICTNMMVHGALVDVPWVERAIPALRAHADQVRAWLREYHGITSPLSAQQIGRAVERLGIGILARTPSGQPQFDVAAIKLYSTMYPGPCADLMGALRDVRGTEKQIGTYLENFLSMRDSNDRLHPSLWVCEAQTSRMTCSEPNLQNLHREAKVIRGSIIPSPGNVLISIDASQIEARLGAHFSRDPALIEAFRVADETGQDLYASMARVIYQDPSIAKKDGRRQITKNVFFSRQFGAGLDKMAATAGIPLEQMRPFKAAMDARYPGIDAMMRMTIAEGRRQIHQGRPAVYLPTGRRLLCAPGSEYVLANRRIQGHAAEILKLGATKLDAIGLGPYMILPVHDEFLLDIPREMAADALRAAITALNDTENYLVPILWEGEIMPERWSKS